MLFILLAAIFYSTAIMFGAAASRALNSNIVTAIINTLSATIPILVALPLLNRKTLENGKMGILFAVCSGIAIALFALFLNKSLQLNKVALVSPIVFGGMIFLTAIFSYFIFKEKLPPLHLTGLAVLGVGLLVIVYSSYTGK